MKSMIMYADRLVTPGPLQSRQALIRSGILKYIASAHSLLHTLLSRKHKTVTDRQDNEQIDRLTPLIPRLALSLYDFWRPFVNKAVRRHQIRV